jgi:small-conductance mechanosensitive channel
MQFPYKNMHEQEYAMKVGLNLYTRTNISTTDDTLHKHAHLMWRMPKHCASVWNYPEKFYININRVLSPIFLLKLTLFLSEKCMCVAKLVWSGFSALRPPSFTNIDFCYVLFYIAALPRWRRGLTYTMYAERCIHILIWRVFLLLKCIKM